MSPWSKRVVTAAAIALVVAAVAGGIAWRVTDPGHRAHIDVVLPDCPRMTPEGHCESSTSSIPRGAPQGVGPVLAVTSLAGALAFFVALELLFRRARKRDAVAPARVV